MLKHLFIQNFILIEEVNLDFESGFTAFTGETGAGKSILMDAISLLASERASTANIMKGKDRAIVEGTFDLTKDAHACAVLQEAGFDVSDTTVFTREMHSSGKSVARIDHRVVTLGLMKDCLKNQIDIHGQRDTAYLLNVSSHIGLLDEYLALYSEQEAVKKAYQVYDSLVRERDLALQETYNENDLEYFRYEAKEIEDADLKPGEDEELEEKEKQYRTMRDSLEKLHHILDLYDSSASEPMYEIVRLSQTMHGDEETETIASEINDSYYAFSDAVERLRDRVESSEMSEEEINAVEERLYTIQRLKRKHGRSIEAVLQKYDELLAQIEMIDHRQEYLAKKEKEIAAAFRKYEAAAADIRRKRIDGAKKLDQEILRHLKDLKLPHAVFHTEITESKPSAKGSDRVEFMISMNPGEDLKPLSRTASGGELSRLMLGLKVLFTRLQGIETVIFDEIDTGVSGPVATAIGRKMKELSSDAQVFSITHLAQVAACAERQCLVSKEQADGRTHTSVHELSREERIRELALIVSGDISSSSLKAAEELLERNSR